MAIDLTGLSSTPSTSTRSKLEGSGQSHSGKNQQEVSDKAAQPGTVTFSNEAQSLQKLEEQVGQLPDVNSERVESIRKAIEDGSYGVDAERLATKILDLEGRIYG
ncbi:flagellar biosynthesis anti-sigma factor FlgM [Motiliproteus sp. MSK22-1]|uniref:flagellar biosynthesis anti-sigma factor FlgM n=1 Tax=Motiliproteus sp. MSK22-1 TaxID=1897630 RepID=UPI0009755208|nr:flagellar biosynthesis anti-sigma factor FlgM [Motiliproteus sp. MSK22-1]OMH29997.1 flagellar biosynthesis anti-sigma factor FlgM [Motiliproteus sp. MSK22-1]